ncbi:MULTISPECIES: metallophosphoesterase [unclassified Paenibacillus]|uniref:metallophosphoesterase n=1 Tax=unclassified Paenibacillus TaxID=185978 RepID=UPI001E327378|nr:MULTISPECIES: metallophosphoesterase [unclassified Paenibacillus]CAH0118715.1 putative protein YpbG [Paenibacillus sp. CECT 9249]
MAIAAGLAAIAIAILIVIMAREAQRTRVEELTVELERLPASWDGTVILFVSDLHRRIVPETLVADIRSRYPVELVLIGGDMTERGVPLERTRANMERLRSLGPAYAVHGNHDYKTDYRRLDAVVQECGVKVLDNESVRFEKEGAELRLVGVDDPHTGRDQLRLAFSETEPSSACTLLLAHDPAIMLRLGDEQADLVLAGHTHGGQICVPGLGPLFTDAVYRRYSAGLYESDRMVNGSKYKTKLFVSRGFGTSRLPIRFQCPAEINLITLRSAKRPAPTR